MTTFATVDPTSGEVVREFEALTDREIASAVEQSAVAYASWSRSGIDDRAAVLAQMADLYRENAEELAGLMTLEMGKPVAQALGEVELAAAIHEYYAVKGPALLADEELDIAGSGRAVVRTAPIGPLLGVMPWNFPYYQVARFVAPNLLLGNTVLLKHAPNCPQQSLRMAQIAQAAGAPPGVFENLFASTDQVADIIANPHVQGVSLTGSERAGRAIGELAGRHLKKCVLELGGSDPLIVLRDADLAAAVSAAATGRFGNAGQVCTSSKRLIVDDAVYDQFLDDFLTNTAQWQLGDPKRKDARLGPLASVAARDELADQVQDAVDKGAVLHTGGQTPDGPGAWYPATVISGVTPDMRAFREELFGPVAVLYRVESVDEAVDLANDSPYGLGGAVFTSDMALAHEVADRLEVGMVGINTTVKSAPDLPFGGVKNSGVGRELARFGLDEFSNKKLVRFA
jgi:succinate-semialdehyde dehydrogenase/glutarate-semialdehyde dehydrogenase